MQIKVSSKPRSRYVNAVNAKSVFATGKADHY